MLRRLYRLSSTGKGVVATYPSGPSYPAAGTVLSVACGTFGNVGQTTNLTDVLGQTFFDVAVEVLNLVADGAGGSSWQATGNSGTYPCYYPYSYVYDGYVHDHFEWNAPNGDNGTFYWGQEWNVNYYDGNGGTLHEQGIYNQYDYGYVISANDADGHVVNLQNGNWAFWYGYGFFLTSGWDTYYTNFGCGDVGLYTYQYNVYADGTGGTYRNNSGEYSYPSSGTLLQSDCGGNDYYADGNGSYYSQMHDGGGCPAYGTEISSDSGNYTVNVGCGDWQTGGWGSGTYADGNCGTYGNGGSWYVQYGSLLGNCNDYNYYADGNGGYYQGEYTGSGNNGGSCPEYGTFNSDAPDSSPEVPSGSGNYFFDGNDNVYLNDGNCGTYLSYSGLYSYGTFITNYDNYNYYWDGSGGYYQGEYTGA